jgi:hypothetical protein
LGEGFAAAPPAKRVAQVAAVASDALAHDGERAPGALAAAVLGAAASGSADVPMLGRPDAAFSEGEEEAEEEAEGEAAMRAVGAAGRLGAAGGGGPAAALAPAPAALPSLREAALSGGLTLELDGGGIVDFRVGPWLRGEHEWWALVGEPPVGSVSIAAHVAAALTPGSTTHGGLSNGAAARRLHGSPTLFFLFAFTPSTGVAGALTGPGGGLHHLRALQRAQARGEDGASSRGCCCGTRPPHPREL